MKTIPKPHETYELAKMSLSIDAKYFLTFGYEEEPTIKLWNWLDEENEPLGKIIIKLHLKIVNNKDLCVWSPTVRQLFQAIGIWLKCLTTIHHTSSWERITDNIKWIYCVHVQDYQINMQILIHFFTAKIHIEDTNRDVITIIFDPSCSNEFCMAFERKLIFGYITMVIKKKNLLFTLIYHLPSSLILLVPRALK